VYIKRTIEKHILDVSDQFKVLLLTGPRQIGKTTVLENLQKESRSYVSLDALDVRLAAKEDPAGLIDRLSLPVLIDEVQYAPELFSYIKMMVDKEKIKKGLFWMTGSQQFSMMKNISESLAGRVGILNMGGISLAEEEGRPETPAFIPTPDRLKHRHETARILPLKEIYNRIWRGSYPDIVMSNGSGWQSFYESYILTYAERDVRDYLQIDHLVAFRKFIQVAAARTGQMINYREIAKEVGVSEPTIKSWFNVMEATGLITFIYPYYKNVGKRILKTPKLYFLDTGLCCYLTKWTNPEVLENGAMAGAILETWVVSEIVKSWHHNGQQAPLYYYADKDKREVDLLIEQAGQLHPIEIKKTASVRNSGFKGFDYLKSLKTPIGHGCILCFSNSFIPYNKEIDIVPIGYL
jgi:predicted AAA+ superfamily ATPase